MNKLAAAIERIEQTLEHRADSNWNESDHPRAANGQFGSGGGGSSLPPKQREGFGSGSSPSSSLPPKQRGGSGGSPSSSLPPKQRGGSGGGGEAPKSSAPTKSGSSGSLTKHPELASLISEMKSSGVKVKASGNSIEVKDPTPIGSTEDVLEHRIKDWGPTGPYGKYLDGLGMSAKVEGDFTWTGPKGRESFSNGYTVLKIELHPKQ